MKKKMGVALSVVMLAGAMLSGCAESTPSDTTATMANQKVALSMSWWGSQERNTRTNEVIKLFMQQHPEIEVTPIFSPWNGYWDKLSTSISGGNPPDVIQMDPMYIREYTERGTLQDLSGMGMNLADIPTLKNGEVNGKLTGVPIGVTAMTIMYDPALLQKAGITVTPQTRLTWDEYANTALQVAQKLGNGFYGSSDLTENFTGIDLLNYYIRQHNGETEFNKDMNGVSFSKQTLVDFLSYNQKLIKTGAVPPASVTAGITDIPQSQLILGKSAFELAWSNQLITYNELAKRPLSLMMPPTLPGGNEAQYVDPSMFLSIPAASKHQKEAAMLIDFFVNSPEAGKILGTERGLPVSTKVVESLRPTFSDADKQMFDYVDLVSKNSTPRAPAPPKSYNEFMTELNNAVQQVGFEKSNPNAAADYLLEKANQMLKK